jgi:hypothetical protein
MGAASQQWLRPASGRTGNRRLHMQNIETALFVVVGILAQVLVAGAAYAF